MMSLMPLKIRKTAIAHIKQPTINIGVYNEFSGWLNAKLNMIGPIKRLNMAKIKVFMPLKRMTLSVLFSMVIILNG